MPYQCKAKDPTKCPHHGVSFVLDNAAQEGDFDKFLAIRAKLSNKDGKPQVASNTDINPKGPGTSTNGLSSKEHKMLWKRLRGAYLLKELKAMTVTDTTVANVSYNRNGEAAFSYEVEETHNSVHRRP